MKIAILLLIAGGIGLTSSRAIAFDNFKDFKRDRWDFESSLNFYRTESNFNQSGKQDNLPAGNYLQDIGVNMKTRYYVRKNASIFLSGLITAAESRDAAATRNNSSFTQLLAGGDWLAYSEGFDVVPEVSAVFPMDKTAAGGDSVINSEGVLELRPKITLQKQWSGFGAYAYGGFTYRDQGRSFLLPYGIGAFIKNGDSRLGAEVFGYESLTDDKDTKDRAKRTAALIMTNGGSYKYASVNPSLMDTNFFYHYGVRGPWSVEVDGGISILGMNAASGYHVGALIRYSFDMTQGYVQEEPVYHATPVELPKGRSKMYDSEPSLSTGSKLNKFREDTSDGVDQRIFRNRALSPKPKPIKRKAAPTDDSLQQQLDDTEMQIELKSNKRRKKK